MRKAPKSVNNCLVSFRPLLQLRITEARHQCDRASLPLAILCMLERQIQKHTLVLGQAEVKSSDDGSLCHGERLWIGGKCARRVAEHVARHLVQNDHGGKRGLGIGQQAVISAGRENFMQAEEALAYARIKRRVLLEPLVRRSLLEPKLQDVLNPPILGIVSDRGSSKISRVSATAYIRSSAEGLITSVGSGRFKVWRTGYPASL